VTGVVGGLGVLWLVGGLVATGWLLIATTKRRLEW
jgi:hypothetical protein